MEMRSHTMAVFLIIWFLFCTSTANFCNAAHNHNTVNIGIILDADSWIGKVAKTTIQMAVDDVNRDSNLLSGSRLVLHFRDSRDDAVVGASEALDLLERGVVAIIGPQQSGIAEFIVHLGDAAQVPVVSFSVTNPLLSNHRFPYFVPMAHSDALQMQPIAALAQAYGWRRITAVYSDDEFGSGAISSLNDALRDVESEIEYRSAISSFADGDAIREELFKLKTMESRVFVAHMNSNLGSKIFMEAHRIGMMDTGYVWITTDGFTSLWDVLLNDSTTTSMQGLLGVKTYIQKSNKLADFSRRWKRQFRRENPDEEKAELNLYGLFAYDAVWMIARAIENLGDTRFNFSKPASSAPLNTTDFTQVKVFQEGPQLLQEILKTKFSGVSGVVQLHNGEIVGSDYQIVNLVGNSFNVVGYWSDETQLSKEYDYTSAVSTPSSQNNTMDKLKTVIWPGGSTEVPRGWVLPTSGRRMRIGVPIADGVSQFVSVTFDRSRNQSKVVGFCIDVFDAVLSRLDYALPYDLIPYATDQYGELVYQVYLKKFDAVVGDTTILANRSRFVDFTQPYTESGLVMVASTKAGDANTPWAFMLPFTRGMWCTIGAFLLFTGFVIWLLEHKFNHEFGGSPREQLATLLWFSFSTLFFSQREKLESSLSRLVVIMWLFVVLIVTSSYTASLTSMLTVQQLNPTVKDVDSLRSSGAPVGYQQGSFVGEYLQEHFQIAKKNLRPYLTLPDAAEALSKGPNNGGVAAIFDEIPYIRIFLASECGYTTVGPVYRTGGFGFVFPKGSPLVSDVSMAVLSLSEDKEMQEIEDKWFNGTGCAAPGANGAGSNRLSVENFWGLYLITGMVSLIALMIFLFMHLYYFLKNHNISGEIGDRSLTRESLMSLLRSMKLFLVYLITKDVEQEGASSAPEPRGSENQEVEPYLPRQQDPCSPPAFTSSPSAHGTSPLGSPRLSGGSFPFREPEDTPDADAGSSSVLAAEITEDNPPNRTP